MAELCKWGQKHHPRLARKKRADKADSDRVKRRHAADLQRRAMGYSLDSPPKLILVFE